MRAILGYALKLVGNRGQAEDLTADAFVALIQHKQPLEPALVQGWLKRVVRNAAIDVWRRRATEEKYAHLLVPRPLATQEPMEDWLQNCVALRPIHRTCLMLQLFEGFSLVEIAAATGLSQVRVKGYLQYGMKILRKTYKESASP